MSLRCTSFLFLESKKGIIACYRQQPSTLPKRKRALKVPEMDSKQLKSTAGKSDRQLTKLLDSIQETVEEYKKHAPVDVLPAIFEFENDLLTDIDDRVRRFVETFD